MITPTILDGEKFSDLPLGLQSYILSFLSGDQQPSLIEISIDAADKVTVPLPKDLLPVAQASSSFATATANTLGSRATFLTSTVAKSQLAQWVTALGPFVRAVSTNSFMNSFSNTLPPDSDAEETPESAASAEYTPPDELFVAEGLIESSCRSQRTCSDLPDDINSLLNDTVLELFGSLSGILVSLEVLDLKCLPLHNLNGREDELLSGLVSSLTRACESLKELSLPVTDLCANALAMVTLKNLNVIELVSASTDFPLVGFSSEEEQTREPFLQMLQALDGHADRSQKSNKLRELRLVGIHSAPCLDATQSGCTPSLFTAVRKLRLVIEECSSRDHDSIATFISLFANLECLDWDGMITPGHLQLINSACVNVREIHLHPYGVFNSPPIDVLPDDEPVQQGDESILGEIFAACEGKLKSLTVHGKPTTEQMEILGQRNPGLQYVGMEIGLGSVGGLASLLGSHCRQIQKLEVTVLPDVEVEGLGNEGWQKFTEAVCSASEELSEVKIGPDEGNVALEPDIKPVLQSMHDVLEFLGERARKIHFAASSDGQEEFNVLVHELSRILKTCFSLARNLKSLVAMFFVDNTSDGGDQDKELYEQFLLERRKLLERLPLLSVNLDRIEDDVQYRLDHMSL